SCALASDGGYPSPEAVARTERTAHRDPGVRDHVRIDHAVPGTICRTGEALGIERHVTPRCFGVEHVHRRPQGLLEADGLQVVIPSPLGDEQEVADVSIADLVPMPGGEGAIDG